MANAAQILSRKRTMSKELDDPIAFMGPEELVIDAAQKMNELHIGSILVLDDHRKVLGIFTERDVMRRIVVEERDPAITPLADVMTTPVACARPETTTDELRAVMRQKRVRHIPVIDADERAIGMISIGDLNQAEINTQVQTIRYLQQYISVG